MNFFKFFIFLVLTNPIFAQDSIRVMQYNLLNYGLNSFGCSNSAAAMAIKDANFKKIIKEINPDILAVNEMANNSIYGDRILQNVLNTDGVNHFERGVLTNLAGSNIVNMLFYNSDKLALQLEEAIQVPVRDINLSRLYYKDSLLGTGIDTVFITVINGHLKAGSSSSDQNQRDLMTQEIITVLSAKGVRDNYLVLGDFNSRSSSEQGIQNLLNPSDPNVKFVDPISSPGSWNNNSNFANIHTQSTNVSGGCPSGGGMDDRFDVIFASEYIMGDSAGAEYIPGTYTAFGQDGNHFNGNINDGTNNAVADSIADALFEMSDHLPVYLDLEIEKAQVSGFTFDKGNSRSLSLVKNPVENNIELELDRDKTYLISITNTQSRIITERLICSHKSLEIPFEKAPGLYFLTWVNSEGERGSIKILKN